MRPRMPCSSDPSLMPVCCLSIPQILTVWSYDAESKAIGLFEFEFLTRFRDDTESPWHAQTSTTQIDGSSTGYTCSLAGDNRSTEGQHSFTLRRRSLTLWPILYIRRTIQCLPFACIRNILLPSEESLVSLPPGYPHRLSALVLILPWKRPRSFLGLITSKSWIKLSELIQYRRKIPSCNLTTIPPRVQNVFVWLPLQG